MLKIAHALDSSSCHRRTRNDNVNKLPFTLSLPALSVAEGSKDDTNGF